MTARPIADPGPKPDERRGAPRALLRGGFHGARGAFAVDVTRQREVPQDEFDAVAVLVAQVFDDGIGGPAAFAFEVEELDKRHPGILRIVEAVATVAYHRHGAGGRTLGGATIIATGGQHHHTDGNDHQHGHGGHPDAARAGLQHGISPPPHGSRCAARP